MHERPGLFAVLGLSVALVACGSNGTTSKTTTTPTPTTAATTTTLSTAQLQASLLDVSDVGAVWKVGAAINPQDLAGLTQIPCADATISPTIAKRLTAVTGIQFESTDGSSKHLMQLVVTGEPKQLDSDLQALIGAMESCSATTSTTTGTAKLTVKKFIIPELGDQRAAYLLTDAESPGTETTWYVRQAAVRVGSVAMGIGLTEILGTPQDKPQISDAKFVQLLETAVAKFNG